MSLLTWEAWVERNNLKHDTAHAPHVHLVVVVTISQQALRRTVPAAGMCAGSKSTNFMRSLAVR